MKQKNYRFTEEDISLMEEIKGTTGVSSDIDVIRFALRHTKRTYILNGEFSVYTKDPQDIPSIPKNSAEASPVRKCKFTDGQIEGYVNNDGNDFTFCPFHTNSYLRGCGCLKDRSLLEKKLRETYEPL